MCSSYFTPLDGVWPWNDADVKGDVMILVGKVKMAMLVLPV